MIITRRLLLGDDPGMRFPACSVSWKVADACSQSDLLSLRLQRAADLRNRWLKPDHGDQNRFPLNRFPGDQLKMEWRVRSRIRDTYMTLRGRLPLMPIRVLIVDDHLPIRLGFSTIIDLADDIEVVGEATDGEQALQMVQTLHPDVVLMDVKMPRVDGITATRKMSALGVTNVLLTTAFDDDENLFGALRAGAAGFVLKGIDGESLLAALRHVANGDGVIDPSVTRRMIADYSSKIPEPAREEMLQALDRLTEREREVLACIGRGMSNRQIARKLDLAENTAKTHVSRVLTKLNLNSRVQAAILAQEVGLC